MFICADTKEENKPSCEFELQHFVVLEVQIWITVPLFHAAGTIIVPKSTVRETLMH